MAQLILQLLEQLAQIGYQTYEDAEAAEAQQIADLQKFFAQAQAMLSDLQAQGTADKAAFAAAVAAAKARLGIKD